MNNPIKPVTPVPNPVIESKPADKPIKEVPTSGNPFTESLRTGGLPNAPEEIIGDVAAEATGKKLTREEQIAFINNLPDDLMLEFARRVRSHIEEDSKAKVQPHKPQYVTDFKTLREDSIFDLNIPIQAIDHQIPEYLNVTLKDSNYEPRWIQTSSKRLGQARAQGWSYVTKEDLGAELGVEIEADSAGHFVYIDTVLMKMTKQKLYSQLRSNYLRAIQMTQQNKLHEQMKQAIENEIERSVDPISGLPLGETFRKYKDKHAMNVYSPLGL